MSMEHYIIVLHGMSMLRVVGEVSGSEKTNPPSVLNIIIELSACKISNRTFISITKIKMINNTTRKTILKRNLISYSRKI